MFNQAVYKQCIGRFGKTVARKTCPKVLGKRDTPAGERRSLQANEQDEKSLKVLWDMGIETSENARAEFSLPDILKGVMSV